MESHPNFGTILLVLSNKVELPMHLRVSASITFKNFVKKNWRVQEDCEDKISPQDRLTIKSSIAELMLTSPDQIQRQLSDGITIISREDFPDKWQDLLPTLVERLKSGDFNINNGVLKTAHSIFKRWDLIFMNTKFNMYICLLIFIDAVIDMSSSQMNFGKRSNTFWEYLPFL